MGLPAVTAVSDADSHTTGEKDLVAEHKLNETSKARLQEFFRPFNSLLEEFLGEEIGYNNI